MKKIIITLLTFGVSLTQASLLRQPAITYSPIRVTVAQEQNARYYMEDRFIVNKKNQLFGVFDGHGGQSSVQFIVDNITMIFERTLSNNIAMERCFSNPFQDYDDAFRYSFADIEEQLWEKCDQVNDYGYINEDPFGNDTDEIYGNSGATAIMAKRADNDTIIIANVGDSRAVLIRNGIVIQTTQDHKPDSPEERERIEKAGGIIRKRPGDCWRLNGFALSRSLGDIFAKRSAGQTKNSLNPIISAIPDIYHWKIQKGDILVLASDGLWDVMDSSLGSNDNAVLQKILVEKKSPKLYSAILSREAKRRNSQDNITVLTVQF